MGRQPFNLTDRRFGRLVAKERVGSTLRRAPIWRCICDCGRTVTVKSDSLLQNNTKSCGCMQAEFRNDFFKQGPIRAGQTAALAAPIKITYPIPSDLHPVLQRRYQMRWDRVEREIRLNLPEPQPKPKRIALDNLNQIIKPIDLIALGKRKAALLTTRADVLNSIKIEIVPSSVVIGASITDRVRVMSADELARM